MTTHTKLAGFTLAVPAYLILVHLTSGRLLIGYGQGVWTTEYLFPAIAGLVLAVIAFITKVETNPAKVARVVAVVANLLLCVGLAAATISLWGEFI